ncbi:S1-C subfamily serine protease [Amycolatopsis bartoniae]|uniref:Serine protease n=1 Tax=Amycolatopsis bartoniae TaxID=941986 RepID=A0A8H9IQM4_9PSEU|nr:trypsin-like peptidase domain-containing protein [Amycolatopsis bartoniae]MBB2939537.1 S1-C subfamily serine protease [Amycolatopsis bartoniae]TVT00039.1 PDZ domain-containing protein [Amycolatopsis bartoniae]GHF39014.1 serine protease [Amycolatopsis bartoniae]
MSYYPPPPPQRTAGPLRTLGLVLGALALTLLVGAGFFVGSLHHTSSNRSLGLAPDSGTSQNTGTSVQSLDAGAVAEKVDPGLVDVNTTLGYQNAQAAGTGMVLTADGIVLTNNHVVEGATSISVTDIGNGKTYQATVLGYDRTEDVAVLQLKGASGLKTITAADSSKVAVGDAVVGIGNAGGTGGTPSVAAGTVTALDQSITASDESSGSSEQLEGLIQVNANIQSGDSGGALANSNGQVVGMNTAASTGYQFGGGRAGHRGEQSQQQSQSAGATGYAIPINQALGIATQIEAGNASNTVHIGSSAFLGVSVTDSQEGAVVQQVVSGAPAEEAGLAAGDVLTGINGKTVDSATTLTTLMDGFHPGDKVTLTWTDQSGAAQSGTVTLADGPVG